MRPIALNNTLVKRSIVLQRLLVVVATVGYIILFVILYPFYGPMISALSGIPAMTTSYLYGKWYGLLGAVLYLLLNFLLFILVADLTVQQSIWHILSLGSLMLIGIAFVFGYMGDITKDLREKINEYENNLHK